MAYLVVCTFDLKNASATDYENAYADLEKIGLNGAVISANGKRIVAPTTMTIAEINGDSAASVRDLIRRRVKAAFAARGFSSEIFVAVGDNWAWGADTT
jgi:hypothetical protein